MILGMGLVFLSLVVIMVVMMGLDRAFPYKPQEQAEAEPPSERVDAFALAPSVAPAAPPRAAEGEVGLAIALAVARARAEAATVVPARAATLVVPSGEVAARQWDWLWDAGLDDYGTTKGSRCADIHDNC